MDKSSKDSMFPDYTKEFYDYLYFDKEELFKGHTGMKHRIKQLPIILQSMMGMGKTTLAENVISKICSWYGKENCNAIYTNEYPLKTLMFLAFKGFPKLGWDAKKPIQIVIFDDASGVRIQPLEQRQFLSLRHLMFRDTGIGEGVVYSIFLTHDWYALDKTFRRNAMVSCFLSIPPLDRFSRNDYRHYIGKEGVSELEKITHKAIKFDQFKGKGLVALPFKPNGITNVGYVKWSDMPRSFYWKLTRKAEEVPECLVDTLSGIIEYYEPETKKIKTQKDGDEYVEKIREQGKERSRTYRERRKKEMDEIGLKK